MKTIYRMFLNDPVMMSLFLVFVVACFLILLIPIYLRKKLNPTLDPIFKRHYLYWLNFMPTWSSSCQRAALYSGWVVAPKLLASHIPAVQSYDFRSMMSKTTYVLCWLQQICHAIFLMGLLIFVATSIFGAEN